MVILRVKFTDNPIIIHCKALWTSRITYLSKQRQPIYHVTLFYDYYLFIRPYFYASVSIIYIETLPPRFLKIKVRLIQDLKKSEINRDKSLWRNAALILMTLFVPYHQVPAGLSVALGKAYLGGLREILFILQWEMRCGTGPRLFWRYRDISMDGERRHRW